MSLPPEFAETRPTSETASQARMQQLPNMLIGAGSLLSVFAFFLLPAVAAGGHSTSVISYMRAVYGWYRGGGEWGLLLVTAWPLIPLALGVPAFSVLLAASRKRAVRRAVYRWTVLLAVVGVLLNFVGWTYELFWFDSVYLLTPLRGFIPDGGVVYPAFPGLLVAAITTLVGGSLGLRRTPGDHLPQAPGGWWLAPPLLDIVALGTSITALEADPCGGPGIAAMAFGVPTLLVTQCLVLPFLPGRLRWKFVAFVAAIIAAIPILGVAIAQAGACAFSAAWEQSYDSFPSGPAGPGAPPGTRTAAATSIPTTPAVATPTPTAAPGATPTATATPVGLAKGSMATAANLDGDELRVRSGPGTQYPQISRLLEGDVVILLSERRLDDAGDYYWWQVELTDGTVGWSAEGPADGSETWLVPSATAPVVVPSTWQLVDLTDGHVATLYESDKETAWAGFDGEDVILGTGQETVRLTPDGTSAPYQAPEGCSRAEDGAEIAGRFYQGVSCGFPSPDGLWMTYRVSAGEVTLPGGQKKPTWDQWLVNLRTGETQLLQDGLVDCTPCGVGPPGPAWSPSSRYLTFRERAGETRGYLADVQTGITRRIGFLAEWSPVADILVHGASGAPSVLEDLPHGTVHTLPVAWPITFDPSGTIVYSLVWSAPTTRIATTTVVDVATGTVKSVLAGTAPSWSSWAPVTIVSATPSGIVSALQGAPGCPGTAIYVDASVKHCVLSGVEGRIGPGGLIAVAVKTGTLGPASGPGWGSVSATSYEILVVSPEGVIRARVTGAISVDLPPLISWSPDGSRILVSWPRFPPE